MQATQVSWSKGHRDYRTVGTSRDMLDTCCSVSLLQSGCDCLHKVLMQAKVREQHGAQVTAFDQVVDGERILRKGDAVHMATKPIFAGRALRFLVGQASLC